MVRRLFTLTTLVVLAGGAAASSLHAQTPPLPTIDQVLDKYIAAAGGRAAIEKITSAAAKGTIQIPDVGISGTIELYQKAPDKALTVAEFSGMGGQRQGFDGTVGWTQDDQNGLRQLDGAELADVRRSAILGRELKMKTIYPTMTVKAREKVGTRDAFLVEAVPADGAAARLDFDAESGLLLRQVATRQTSQGPLEVEVTFDDYREVDGVKRAFTIRQATAMFTAMIQLTEVKQNVPIDDAIFKIPKGD
ncbi:MAG TPA: hypothetical protein VLT86_14035 [Vicinamibacterales bacterium]|nr:hypothetical protein [Vicinamibacterales bacterium]